MKSLLLILFLLCSCATRKSTSIYSSIAGVIAGGFIGKALSPNKESDQANAALGSLVGGVSAYYLGKKIYNNQHPDFKMKNSPLFKNEKVDIIKGDNSEIQYQPSIKTSTKKKYLKVKGEKADLAQKLYLIEHKAEKKVIFGKNGEKYVYPEFQFYEFGVEE